MSIKDFDKAIPADAGTTDLSDFDPANHKPDYVQDEDRNYADSHEWYREVQDNAAYFVPSSGDEIAQSTIPQSVFDKLEGGDLYDYYAWDSRNTAAYRGDVTFRAYPTKEAAMAALGKAVAQ